MTVIDSPILSARFSLNHQPKPDNDAKVSKKHYAQVRSYLKAVRRPVGLLVNFADFQLNARRVELNS